MLPHFFSVDVFDSQLFGWIFLYARDTPPPISALAQTSCNVSLHPSPWSRYSQNRQLFRSPWQRIPLVSPTLDAHTWSPGCQNHLLGWHGAHPQPCEIDLLQHRQKATMGFRAGMLYSVANSVYYTGNNTFGLLAAQHVYLAYMCYVDTCHGICGYKRHESKYLHLEA